MEEIESLDTDLPFDADLEALRLTVNEEQEPPWNIIQWLLASETQDGGNTTDDSRHITTTAATFDQPSRQVRVEPKQEPGFLPPYPYWSKKTTSEKSYCSEQSVKSARSSVPTLDSESDANVTRRRTSRRRVPRRPARYQQNSTQEGDGGESDSTLADSSRSTAKIPRYKRPSHINAEHRRRSKIKVKCSDCIGEFQ